MAVISPEIARYPLTWPVPQKARHEHDIDTGLVRSSQQGFPQQFRAVGSAPTLVRATFRVPTAELEAWWKWVNTYAVTRWALIPLVDQYERIDPNYVYDWSMARFVGFISSEAAVGEGLYDVTCELDVWPESVGISRAGQANAEVVWPGMPLLPGRPPLPECRPFACDAIEAEYSDAVTMFTVASKPATPAEYLDAIPYETIPSSPSLWGSLFDLEEMTDTNPLSIVPELPYIEECSTRLFVLKLGRALRKGSAPPPGAASVGINSLMTGSGGHGFITYVQEWRQDESIPTTFRRTTRFGISVDEAPAGTMRININSTSNSDHFDVTLNGFDAYNPGGAEYPGQPFSVWSDPASDKIWRIVSTRIERGEIYLITPTQWGFDVVFTVNMQYYDITGAKQIRTQTATITVASFNVNVGGNDGVVVFDGGAIDENIYPIGGNGTMFLASLADSATDLAEIGTFEEWRLAIERNRLDYEPPAYCLVEP
jgi:hypothetical protein